jgi:excisionase family DNA binding protein
MSPKQLADFLGLPLATLRKWRVTGTGPRGYRVGKHVRYKPADVELWLADRADSR